MPISPEEKNPVTGGFLDPERVVDGFSIKEGMRISDFGCGAGYFTIILAERVGSSGKVYAFDVMEAPLDTVRAKARMNHLDNIETIRADLEVLGSSGLPDQSQDIIFLANILFQSTKKENVVKEGSRILKKGGTMIVIDWNNQSGGFGPPNEIRPKKDDVRSIIEKEGFLFESDLDSGKFHFGMAFKKS